MITKLNEFLDEKDKILSDLVNKLMYSLEDKYDIKVDLYYSKFSETIILSKIIVNESVRDTGIGTNVMGEICDFADEHKLKIALTPSSDFGGKITKLKSFYNSFGFKKLRSFDYRETYTRKPQ